MTIRLCYASQRNENSDDLLEDLQNILSIAREFNLQNDICGVLYYADNIFFQCLEGEKILVESLFERIKKDPRHHHVIHFGTHEISKTCFKKWSMKYVQRNSNIENFFKKLGHDFFNPTCFNQNELDSFLNELLHAEQSNLQVRRKIGFTNRGINPYL